MVTQEGLEPPTLWFVVKYSNPTELLSHLYIEVFCNWWAHLDSNQGPTGYEPVALTNWAIGPSLHQTYKQYGAENETRTRDPHLGKVMLYQLSYFRILSDAWLQKFFCVSLTDKNYYIHTCTICQHLFSIFFKVFSQRGFTNDFEAGFEVERARRAGDIWLALSPGAKLVFCP